jgi:hypothetical protein
MEENEHTCMIFAELDYPGTYSDFHHELVVFVAQHFSQVKSGLQGDSWISVLDDGEKVAIDSFSSMKHQVKSRTAGPHVQKVIDTIQLKYKVHVYDKPEQE